ncbi:hypothetical protein ACSBL2_20550 [Pedobacter sp. AW31-3R]|uniref:hypothetical protein n=1 Tax=Pedobacter sp. AW31-3R TaxID=3445781 RepID=UPI003F9F3523
MIKRYIIYPALAMVLMLGSCELVEVENPNLIEDRFLGAGNSAVEWTDGMRRQMSVVVGSNTEFTELVSDNYFNNYTSSSKVFDIPQINYFDQDVANLQAGINRLMEMCEYGLTKVFPADAQSTPLQKAEVMMYKAYGHLLSADLFVGMPATPLGEVLSPEAHRNAAIALLNEAQPLFTAADDRLVCALLRARAYYGLGNAQQARSEANTALQNPLLLRQVKYGQNSGLNNNFQGNIFTTSGTNPFAPLPRLDFLDPKYFNTDQVAANDQKPIAIAKAEEAYLIIAEAMVSANELTAAQGILKSMLTDCVSKRATVSLSDKAETRNGGNRKDYPLTAVNVKFDATSPEKAGYVYNRQAGNITAYLVSGTKVTAAEIDAANTQDGLLYLVYLLRQEIFIAEGRRMTDLGIRFPVSQREQLGNTNVKPEHTQAILPAFIPKNREMDDFEVNVATGVVTMKHDMNKVLVQNKTATGIMPFMK